MTDAPGGAGVASREAAYDAVRRVHATDAWSGPVVDGVLRRSDLPPRDRAFAANLAYSTLRWEGTLDWALGFGVQRPLAQVQDDVLDVLRIGAWQLLYGGTPDRAAVDTAVEVARRKVGAHVTGFVNGALRGLARRRETLPWPDDRSDDGLARVTGYPTWVAAAARRRFGARARAVLDAGNQPPGLTLRAVGDREALLSELRDLGLDPAAGATPDAVRVGGTSGPVGDLPPVAEGRAVVQDEASMVVALAAAAGQPDTGWRAADLCAAPGGKTTYLAQRGATVTSSDVVASRARLIAEAAERTGLAKNVRVVIADARRPPYAAESFDVVVLDAPCTGLGVVRRRPELRWRRDADDMRRLAQLQADLLDAAVELVRPGGTLLYSVCTWTDEETVGVLRPFLALNGDRVVVEPAPTQGLGTQPANEPGMQLDPAADGTDGMYLCRMRRL